MIATHPTITSPAAAPRVLQVMRELFAATALSVVIEALRGR